MKDGQYQVPWPESLAPGESAAVRLVDNEGREYFYSRVLRPAPGHYKQQAEASGELTDWLASEPKSSQVWLVYARFLENQGHFLESLAALGKAIQLDGPQPDLLQLKTRILLDCGRYAEALETYRQMEQKASQP